MCGLIAYPGSVPEKLALRIRSRARRRMEFSLDKDVPEVLVLPKRCDDAKVIIEDLPRYKTLRLIQERVK